MAVNCVTADRDTPDLFPASVQAYLPQDHLARFVVEIVDQLDLSHPQVLLIAQAMGPVKLRIPTHNVDFLQCAEALAGVLARFPNTCLALHGHLRLPTCFDSVASQVIRVPLLRADNYYRALAGFDINLAPLEPTLFNDAKSNIKLLEAAMFGVPTVASPAAAFRAAIRHGENGFICREPEHWRQALERLVTDEGTRRRIGHRARAEFSARYDYREIARTQLLPVLRAHLPEPPAQRCILFANVLFPPMEFGGATVVARQLAQALNGRDDYRVVIFTGFWDDGGHGIGHNEMVAYEACGMQVFGVRLPRPPTPDLEYINTAIRDRFGEVIDAAGPDLVHLHSVQQLGASLAEACWQRKVPYIVTLHDTWWLCERQFTVRPDGDPCGQNPIDPRVCAASCTEDAELTFSRFVYLRRVLEGARLLLAPSNHQRDLFIANGTAPERIRVNRNGVFAPGPDFWPTPAARTRFGFLGGRGKHKGYPWLKAIFESIPRANYVLQVVDVERTLGMEALTEDDWEIAGELRIREPLAASAMDLFYSDVDVLLFPSRVPESFGLTVREALIRGIWVIATDCGGPVEDIEPGVTGVICPLDDAECFRRSIIEAIHHPPPAPRISRGRIREFPEQARELHRYYSDCLTQA